MNISPTYPSHKGDVSVAEVSRLFSKCRAEIFSVLWSVGTSLAPHLLSQLLYLQGELLAVFGVLPLGRLLALHHLEQSQHNNCNNQIQLPEGGADAFAPIVLSGVTVC